MLSNEYNTIERVINLIDSNITKNGVKRYDFADIRGYRFSPNSPIRGKAIRKILLILDSVFPIRTRKILGVEKTYFPTTFSHLAEAYMLMDRVGLEEEKKQRAVGLLERALDIYYVNHEMANCWIYDENHEFLISGSEGKVSTMPLHGLSRLNIALIKASKLYDNSKFMEIAVQSAFFTLNHHNLQKIEDGSVSISYFYNSNDSTINVNTEFLQWISMIPQKLRTSEMEVVLKGILKFVIQEQNEDGSWYYYSKAHMKVYGNAPSIDCHHTGTVLSNLLFVLENEYSLDNSLRDDLRCSIEKGYDFYINNFFDFKTGCAKNILGFKRPAGPVQYSEAIMAMCELKKSLDFASSNLIGRVDALLPLLVKKVIGFVKKDGSVPSEKILFWMNIDSIRWGNGILMQALLNYYLLLKHEVDAVEESKNEYK